jgi:uncharacterized membrane protein
VAAVLAALSSLVFGVGDFLGGMSARRMAAALAAVTAQGTGLVFLVVAAVPVGGTVTTADWVWGTAAGTCGAVGLLLFYWALANGQVSVVTPLSAVTSALVPFTAGLALGDRPEAIALLGAVAALPAIVLISREPADDPATVTDTDAVALDGVDLPVGEHPPSRRVLAASLGSGVGFGGFLVCISRVGDDSGLWPLVGARGTTAALMALVVVTAVSARPTSTGVRFAVAAGCCDVSANVLYLVAVRQGMLSLVGVLGSLYPASAVLLARFVLRERLAPHQLSGLALAAVAVAAVALG